jgi:hypothetical protein
MTDAGQKDLLDLERAKIGTSKYRSKVLGTAVAANRTLIRVWFIEQVFFSFFS